MTDVLIFFATIIGGCLLLGVALMGLEGLERWLRRVIRR